MKLLYRDLSTRISIRYIDVHNCANDCRYTHCSTLRIKSNSVKIRDYNKFIKRFGQEEYSKPNLGLGFVTPVPIHVKKFIIQSESDGK